MDSRIIAAVLVHVCSFQGNYNFMVLNRLAAAFYFVFSVVATNFSMEVWRSPILKLVVKI